MLRRPWIVLFLAICNLQSAISNLDAADWYNWRGPWQTGVSPETNLPASWSPEGDNLVWKAPVGCRSTPLIMNGRVYLINYTGERETIQERVMCLDANTGKTLWEHKFNVFHTDIVTVRLGWTNLAGDPETGNIYAHGTQGLFFCFDKDGKVLWSRSLSEEFGRISGYGGRVTSPVIDEERVIVGMLNSSWGDQGKGGCRFVAMYKHTGQVLWWSEPGGPPKDTYYSVPVIAVIGGQRLLISGGADGGVYAMKSRTGEPVWTYTFGTGAINCSPVVDGNYVYIGHGAESFDINIQGRFICLDGSKVDKDGQPELVWKKDGLKAMYASPAIHEGRVYIPDEIGKLFCLDAKTGKQYWKYSYGRNLRGSPLIADGKIYIGEVNSRFHILKPGDKKCEPLHEHFFPGAADVEINGTAAAANGRVYFATSDELFCIGLKDAKPAPEPKVDLREEPASADAKAAHLQVLPADVAIHAGDTVAFNARLYDDKGRFLRAAKVDWSLPAAPLPPGAKAPPPPLDGTIADGKLSVNAKKPSQQGYVLAKADGLTAKARVRVAPSIPYAQDFDKVPVGAVPAGWVNTQGKFVVKSLEGNNVLAKVNDKASPLVARGNAYIALPTSSDYTIESDVMGTEKGSDMPDVGVVANRYTLFLSGNVQKLRLVSWDALPRIETTMAYAWKPGVWYRLKLTVDVQGGKAVAKGKIWERGQSEPTEWSIEANDPRPNTEGSPALYGYVTGIPEGGSGTDIYYDNVKITPNKK